MKQLLISTLEQLNYPVILQGSLNKNEPYPDSFFTFWNYDTYSEEFYDNSEHETIWNFELNFYSNDPALVNQVLIQAKLLLKQNGFIVVGKGHDVVSDEMTHTGRGITVLKIEK